jgi:hypothetical protein
MRQQSAERLEFAIAFVCLRWGRGDIRGNIQIVHYVHYVQKAGRIGRSGRIGRI